MLKTRGSLSRQMTGTPGNLQIEAPCIGIHIQNLPGKKQAGEQGLERRLQEAGAELIADTCIDEACCWGHLAGKPGVTDSPKAAYYTETAGIRMAVRDTDTCIRWAQKGGVC